MKAQSLVDKWFMRGKDIFLLLFGSGTLIACWGIYTHSIPYFILPTQVDAQAAEISTLRSRVDSYDVRFSKIETAQEYTNKGVDDIKGWLKNISTKINR